ncbi:hypothetical protein EVAR_54733_1 [Eumeta japonica]|uniref:Uncharacterized protein n=1 Tax=Eumeta variegata TaxID=151549 RepID=A0A4C1Z167_EUMVA|nr:hypothetical protein EVAR_54733_1 [Eumeta japonica]
MVSRRSKRLKKCQASGGIRVSPVMIDVINTGISARPVYRVTHPTRCQVSTRTRTYREPFATGSLRARADPAVVGFLRTMRYALRRDGNDRTVTSRRSEPSTVRTRRLPVSNAMHLTTEPPPLAAFINALPKRVLSEDKIMYYYYVVTLRLKPLFGGDFSGGVLDAVRGSRNIRSSARRADILYLIKPSAYAPQGGRKLSGNRVRVLVVPEMEAALRPALSVRVHRAGNLGTLIYLACARGEVSRRTARRPRHDRRCITPARLFSELILTTYLLLILDTPGFGNPSVTRHAADTPALCTNKRNLERYRSSSAQRQRYTYEHRASVRRHLVSQFGGDCVEQCAVVAH